MALSSLFLKKVKKKDLQLKKNPSIEPMPLMLFESSLSSWSVLECLYIS